LENHFSNFTIELEAETIVKRLWCFEPLNLDCLDYITELVNVYVCSISRQCNKVAHGLASLSKFVGYNSWKGCMPKKGKKKASL
jgi:hypothetical protein